MRALTKIRLKEKDGTYRTEERVMKGVSRTIPTCVTRAVWPFGRLTTAMAIDEAEVSNE